MTSPTDGTQSSTSTAPAAGAAPAAGSSGAPAGAAPSTATKISSLADLKANAPQVYHAMMMGIAQVIINDMDKQQQRLKESMSKNRDQS